MNFHTNFVESGTPAAPFSNVGVWPTEDSGYHTPYTPTEYSQLSNDSLNSVCAIQFPIQVKQFTPEASIPPHRRYNRSIFIGSSPIHEQNYIGSPPSRRGKKRPLEDDSENKKICGSLPTPTSFIAGGIQKLNVNDSCNNFDSGFQDTSSYNENISPGSNNLCSLQYVNVLSYPTTPVKRICRSSSNILSPNYNTSANKSSPHKHLNNSCQPRRSAKKLKFSTSLQSLDKSHTKVARDIFKIQSKPRIVKTIFRPEQKIDLIKMLYKKMALPALSKIFSYLKNEDIYNFSLVNSIWLQACESVPKANTQRKEYMEFVKNTKENYNSRKKNEIKEVNQKSYEKSNSFSLKEIHNVVNTRCSKQSPKKSPPSTPKTMRFKKFFKSASLDSRGQLVCVRCCQPAKVNVEPCGEEWAECSNISCSFQFCRFCKCERHPGKKCFEYNLEEPSPSKRKKTNCVVGTKKSKKNLRRLL